MVRERQASKPGVLSKDPRRDELRPTTIDLMLAEYSELGNTWRHDDQTAAQLTATLFPLAIGAVILPFVYHELARLPVALGSVLMMAFWLLYYLRIEARIHLRFQRMKELERMLGFEHHTRFDTPGLDTRVPSIKWLRVATFFFYCAMWVLILLAY